MLAAETVRDLQEALDRMEHSLEENRPAGKVSPTFFVLYDAFVLIRFIVYRKIQGIWGFKGSAVVTLQGVVDLCF